MKGTIRFCVTALAALFFGLTATAAKVTTWKGGPGNFSDDNWDNGVPETGDTVVLSDPGAGGAITNDIEGLTVAVVKAVAGDYALTLCGKEITVTSWTGLNLSDKTGANTFYTPLRFTSSAGSNIEAETATINFYGAVTALGTDGVTRQKLTFVGANFYFHAPLFTGDITCGKNLLATCNAPIDIGTAKCGFGCNFRWDLKEPGNRLAIIEGYYSGSTANCAYALPEDFVFQFRGADGLDGMGGSAYGNFNLNGDQICDRISGEVPPIKAGETLFRDVYHVNGSGTSTLTLRGTADALTYAQMIGKLSIVWDSAEGHVQTFKDRRHTMSGSITVKRGTIRSAGTNNFASVKSVYLHGGTFEVASSNATCLAALTTLDVFDGGVFRVTEDADLAPFGDGVTVTLKRGGTLELPEGMAVSATVLSVDGFYPAAGTYTGEGYGTDGVEEVDWITGAGRVTVSNAGYVSWKAAKDGYFDDPENWATGAVPGPTDTACLTVPGSGYTVTLRDTRTLPAQIRVGNSTGASKLVVDADEAPTATKLFVDEGGEVEIADGRVVTWTGAVQVGEDVNAGRKAVFRVSGGAFTNVVTSGANFTLKKDARLVMTSGVFISRYSQAVATAPFVNEGGEIAVSGGTFGPSVSATGSASSYHLAAGQADFSGGTMKVGQRFGAASPDARGSITFRDQARWSGSQQLYIGNTPGWIDFNLLTPVIAPSTMWAYRNRFGCDGGAAHVVISNMTYYGGEESTHIGGVSAYTKYTSATGIVDVLSTGVFKLNGNGSRTCDWTAGLLQGLEIGYGGSVPTTLKEGHPFYGELNVFTGGLLDDIHGDCAVGVAFGEGRLTVDGGTAKISSGGDAADRARIFSLGTGGGIGWCTVTNAGSLTVKCHAHVGGPSGKAYVQSSAIRENGVSQSVGTLTVADGTAKFAYDLTVGSDGFGTVELVGSAGSVTADELVLTNVASVATSGSCLKFTADADGVKPLTVTKAVTIRGNAKLVVDLSAYQGRKSKLKLLSCASHEGAFAETSVTWPADCPSGADVKWIGNDLYAVRDGYGLMLIVR